MIISKDIFWKRQFFLLSTQKVLFTPQSTKNCPFQDLSDLPGAISQGGEDHRHGPDQEARHHPRHLRTLPPHQDPRLTTRRSVTIHPLFLTY